MTTWLEKKYINLLSSRLERFKWKSQNLANFKCPLCGDSRYNPKKIRGYIYERDNKYWFHCHNESLTLRFTEFLKRMDYRLFSEYRLEELADKKPPPPTPELPFKRINTAIQFNNKNKDEIKLLKKLPKISQLAPDHPAKRYVVDRKIPTPCHSIIRWADNFQAWTNDVLPGKFSKESLKYDEGRIVLPYFTKEGEFYAYQGRVLDGSEGVRYIMIIIDPAIPPLFGLDRVDLDRSVWVVEGPIDSLFLPNALAYGGGHFSALTKVAERDKFIIATDNEPHSTDAKKRLLQMVENGYRVVVWPSFIEQKDINAMVLAGHDPEWIVQVMNQNTYEGLTAKLKIAEWSKC